MDIHWSDEELIALKQVLKVADLSESQFVRRAVRLLAARYGIEFPDERVIAAIRSPVSPGVKKAGGRPPKKVAWEMNHDVPAGDFPRVCPNCNRLFHTDNPRVVSCSDECQVAMENRTAYQRSKRRLTDL